MLEPTVSEVQPISQNPPDITLTCAVERKEPGILINYFLSNQSDETVFTFASGHVDPSGRFVHAVDVVCDAGAGAVNLVLGISPDPLFSPRWRSILHVRGQKPIALERSKNVVATIDLALPLLEWDHYNSGTGWSRVALPEQAVLVHTARLIIDFVRPSRPGYDPEHPGRSAESVWCALPLETPVTLLRHPGFGELGDPAGWPAFNLGPDKDKVPTIEADNAGQRELSKAIEEHRAHSSRPRRRGTSPADMPKQRQ